MLNLDVITKDPDIGKKLLIGSLLVLSGIGMLAILGWTLEIMRQVKRGEEPTMPAFDDIGTFFMDGLKAAAIGLIWSLPVALIVVVMTVFIIFSARFFNNADDAALAIVVLNFCIVGLVFIYMIPLFALFIPALGTLADTGSVREAINIKNAIKIFRANPGGILLAMLMGTFANSLLGSIGSILCLVGIFPAFVVSYALQGQFYGNAYRDATLAE